MCFPNVQSISWHYIYEVQKVPPKPSFHVMGISASTWLWKVLWLDQQEGQFCFCQGSHQATSVLTFWTKTATSDILQQTGIGGRLLVVEMICSDVILYFPFPSTEPWIPWFTHSLLFKDAKTAAGTWPVLCDCRSYFSVGMLVVALIFWNGASSTTLFWDSIYRLFVNALSHLWTTCLSEVKWSSMLGKKQWNEGNKWLKENRLPWRDKEVYWKCAASQVKSIAFKLSSIGKKKSRMKMERRAAKYVCYSIQ